MRSAFSKSIVVVCLLLCFVGSGCRGRRIFVRRTAEPESPAYVPEIPTAQKSPRRLLDRRTGTKSHGPGKSISDAGVFEVESGVSEQVVQAGFYPEKS